jgi:hypothetical protein
MDKRKNNGGNSTVSKGIDKRKNQYLHLLEEASTEQDVISVIKKLKDRSLEGDVQAIKLYLEYYLGKPKETIDQNVTLNNFSIKDLINFDNSKP